MGWVGRKRKTGQGDASQAKKSKPSGDMEALLGRDSPKRSDNDPASTDEESMEDVPDDMDDAPQRVFTLSTMALVSSHCVISPESPRRRSHAN